MNELIKTIEIGNKKAYSARDLYEKLGLDLSQWSRWYQKNIVNNKFAVENEDYVELDTMSRSREFALSIDFSKKLAMLTRTPEGEKVRNYFIEIEKVALQAPENRVSTQMVENLKQTELLLQSVQLSVNNTKAIETMDTRLKIVEQNQAIEIKQDYFTILAYCKRNHIHLSFSEAIQKGKLATKLSKEKGYELRQVSDEKYGYVHSYKEEILKETFQL